jgi:DNA mismatch repair protein MutL
MAIEILPPQLANQIAAGEVVERPASVVKELVENSLDAGATRVDIEIDKGGSKLIRIRDNGSGIAKEELALALSRHATSKLHTLDDLEAILSFGFRGEALASISSVSRLTLTSRTAEQSEAWQAYAEGSQMAVRVIPAAHPVGSTLDVMDLFFNTPARRRFLKSDKTEFTHIDEWLKRIALVRGDIHFTLTHNGKQVRNYRPATNESQYLQRLAQVSGRSFAEQALKIDCEHDGLKLSGYLQSPAQLESACDTHYFYVNGRLVRDRLVNHAVRQAFAELSEAQQPGYVLMLTLDPHQVDVNVHPAKHEVRFHQARYVHDYILQALQSALSQVSELSISTSVKAESPGESVSRAVPHHFDGLAAPAGQAAREGRDRGYRTGAGKQYASNQERQIAEDKGHEDQSGYRLNSRGMGQGREARFGGHQPSRSVLASYGALLSTVPDAGSEPPSQHVTEPMPALLQGQYWVLVAEDCIRLLEVKAVALLARQTEIVAKLATGLVGQPLLMPVSVAADPSWDDTLQARETLLRQLGLELTIRYRQLIIKKVPPYLRDSQLARTIPELLQWLQFEVPTPEALALWMAKQSITGFVSAPLIWSAYCQLDEAVKQATLLKAKVLPWQRWLEEDASE